MFTNPDRDLGTLQSGKEVVVDFPYEDGIIITKIISPCDCAVPTDFRKAKRVQVKFVPKKVPKHLELQNIKSYKTEKNLTVHFTKDGVNQQRMLTITATIHD